MHVGTHKCFIFLSGFPGLFELIFIILQMYFCIFVSCIGVGWLRSSYESWEADLEKISLPG